MKPLIVDMAVLKLEKKILKKKVTMHANQILLCKHIKDTNGMSTELSLDQRIEQFINSDNAIVAYLHSLDRLCKNHDNLTLITSLINSD